MFVKSFRGTQASEKTANQSNSGFLDCLIRLYDLHWANLDLLTLSEKHLHAQTCLSQQSAL